MTEFVQRGSLGSGICKVWAVLKVTSSEAERGCEALRLQARSHVSTPKVCTETYGAKSKPNCTKTI